ALASTKHIRGNHTVTVGVKIFTRPDQIIPPTGGCVPWDRWATDMAVSGERVKHEYGVRASVIERAKTLVAHAYVWDPSACLGLHRPQICEEALPHRVTLTPSPGDGGSADEFAQLRVGDELCGERIFGCLPVHKSLPAGHDADTCFAAAKP